MSEVPLDEALTDALARQRTVDYIVQTLQRLPAGWTVGFQAPGRRPGSAGSGPVGPHGEWNFEVLYHVWGYGAKNVDDAFEEMVAVWQSWDWLDTVQPRGSEPKRSAHGHTPDHYVFDLRCRSVGLSLIWGSPYYPASGSEYGGVMPSLITKDGPQSYLPPEKL
jgi:hypothetical protein